MFRHILIATDGSPCAARAVSVGLELAKSLGSKVTVVTVTDMIPTGPYKKIPWPSDIERFEATAAQSAKVILDLAQEAARALGVSCDTVHVADQAPADGILEASKKSGCDLIVMGSHGRQGISSLLLGSQVNRVVAVGAAPVLVCH